MNEVQAFNGVERYTKAGKWLERMKTTHYIRQIEKEIEWAESEKSVLEARLKRLNDERLNALHWQLLH